MPKLKRNNFLETISYLRQEEHLVAHANVLKTTRTEEEDIALFLEQEYENESLNYPFSPPEFNAKASVWASKIIYYATLLLLYRNDTQKDLKELFEDYEGVIDTAAILSADLCLRFLPQITMELKRIDFEDPLIPILENILNIWHYSAIDTNAEPPEIDFKLFLQNDCLTQLYLNRIIENKVLSWAENPYINKLLNSQLGYYKSYFWNTLKTLEAEKNE